MTVFQKLQSGRCLFFVASAFVITMMLMTASVLVSSAKAQTPGELYSKYVLENCLKEFQGINPPPPIPASSWCKFWFTDARLLPLVEKHLSGFFQLPIRIGPCPPNKPCPVIVPLRSAHSKVVGDPQPQPNIVKQAGLDEKQAALLAREINARSIAQARQLHAALKDALADVEKELDLLEAVKAQLK